MQSQLKILYLDDHEGLRNSMGNFISSRNPYIEFLFAKNAKEALLALQSNPEVETAIIDINLGGVNGLNVIDELRKTKPDLRIVVYTMYGDLLHIEQALRKNINAFVTKDAPAEEFEKALFCAASGNIYYSNNARKIINVLLRNSKTQKYESEEENLFQSYQNLTKTEKEIFELAANQKTTEEISVILKKSAKTVRNQISSVYQKMNVSGRAELAKAAKTLGVVL